VASYRITAPLEQIRNSVSKEIRERRKALNLTQKNLSTLSGVKQSLIAKIEKGTDASYSRVKAILDALDRETSKTRTKAGDIMNSPVRWVQKGDTLMRARDLMLETGYSQLPVCDGELPIGSISESTIIRQIDQEQLDEAKEQVKKSMWHVETVMDTGFPQVDEATPSSLVRYLIRFSSAVLVLRRGKVAGIITKSDLMKLLT